MVKKIVIGVIVVVVILGAAAAYMMNRSRTLSPSGEASLTNGALTVSVKYSRPSVRGRLIFGTKEQGALQPYGVYWRLGANEATEISFNKNVNFNGQPVEAGTYAMYAIPEEGGFEIILNSETGYWGAFEPDHSKDFLKTKIQSQGGNNVVEQYTISTLPMEGGVNVLFEWSDLRWSIPVTEQ
ncbi:MAG: DUF2911 domain-containing protein [Cytophagia bacterium]|nr:DUF2911 domain-containing protein [Cytophagia bacterium]